MVASGRKIRVAVLMGGLSAERGVSLSTGRQILENLDKAKYDVIGVDAALIDGTTLRALKGADREVGAVAEAQEAVRSGHHLASVSDIAGVDSSKRPDVAVIALHGKYGEDGTIQGMLDLLGIPYTGSGVLASALAMDKSMAKKVMAADGIPVPPSVDFVCTGGNCYAAGTAECAEATGSMFSRVPAASLAQIAKMGYPVIVKPSRQGSTIGMTKVNGPTELNDAIKQAAEHDVRILVEKFIEGRELTVGVLGNERPFALPVIEIVPSKGFYDYEAKYTPGATEEIVPAPISVEATKQAQSYALAAHRSLGCRGVSRVDMIMNAAGIHVLEVNTIPGMTPTSLLPTAAAAAGIEFPALLDMLIEFAMEEGMDR
jgi:D-alanine-D-alanine ligase